MEFTVKSGDPEKQRSGCVVVGVFENRKLSESARALWSRASGIMPISFSTWTITTV